MSTVDEIAIKLGLKSGDLKAALADANASIKNFGESGAHSVDGLTGAIHETHLAMRTFHQFLVAGGIFTVVKEFWTMATEYAKKHKDEVDSNVAAVLDFQEGIEHVRDSIGAAAAATFGFLDKAIEGWEALAAGTQAALSGETFASGVRGLQAVEASTRGIAEIEKARAETLKQIDAINDVVAKKEADLKWVEFERLDTATKTNVMIATLQDKFDVLNSTEEKSLAHAQAKLDILFLQNKAQKVLADQEKEDEQKEQAWLDYVGTKKELDLERTLRSEAEQAKLRQDAITDAEVLTNQSLELAQAWEKANLGIANADEYMKQMAITSASMIAQWEKYSQNFGSSGGNRVTGLSDTALQALIAKLTGEITTATNQAVTAGHTDYLAFNPAYQQAQLERQNAQREVDLRSNFRQTVAAFGQNAAEQQFAPNDYQRLLQYLNPDQAKAQASDIAGIASTLKQLFPQQAGAIAR